jgi:isopenicillin N synthase-like dioxygenase
MKLRAMMKLPGAKTRPRDIVRRHDLSVERADISSIPVIDITPSVSGDTAGMQATAEVIRKACIDIGFFYVTKHGVATDAIEAAYHQAERFFDLPEETKLKYDINKLKRHRGYVPIGSLSADPTIMDMQEGFEVGLELPGDDPDYLAGNPLYGPNVWPDELPEFRPEVYRYFEEVLELGHRLFELFALGLGMPKDYFEQFITKPMAQLRLIHYPSTRTEKAVGIGPHTDYEPFTILWQDTAGLQVQNRSGQWIEAPPIPGTFVVNIGDMLQRWTNDLFVSTPHRVISTSGQRRYSLAMFLGTNHDCVVESLETCTSADNPPNYPPTHAGLWTENMHTYAYAYRWDERGKLADPELDGGGDDTQGC